MKEIKLTGRESEIMNILWNTQKPLTISEMYEINSEISINTYRALVKELLRRNYVDVSDIVKHENNTFSRSYKPIFTASEYMTYQLSYKINKTISPECIVATLLDTRCSDAETIDRLEVVLQEHRKKLSEGK